MNAIALLALCGLLPGTDDAPDSLPGVAVEISANGKTMRRVEDVIAWEGAASKVHWTGRLFVNRDDSYRFTVQLQGHATIRIGDKVLLDSETKDGRLTSANIDL